MSVVRLTDAIEPTIFSQYSSVETMQKSAFYGSGALRSDADLAAKLAGGGRTFNVPFWKDLDDSEPDAASDDPNSHAVPSKLTSGTDIARRIIWTKGWSTAHLVQELAGSDPMRRIAERVGAYWARRLDDAAIAVLRGVFADNIANDAGDMVEDISSDSAAAITSAERISAESVMDAAQTMGDAKSALKLLVIHSEVGTRLAKNDLIDFIPDSKGNLTVPTYLGYRVYESDKVPSPARSRSSRTKAPVTVWGSRPSGPAASSPCTRTGSSGPTPPSAASSRPWPSCGSPRTGIASTRSASKSRSRF
jgi:hypothetical protein